MSWAKYAALKALKAGVERERVGAGPRGSLGAWGRPEPPAAGMRAPGAGPPPAIPADLTFARLRRSQPTPARRASPLSTWRKKSISSDGSIPKVTKGFLVSPPPHQQTLRTARRAAERRLRTQPHTHSSESQLCGSRIWSARSAAPAPDSLALHRAKKPFQPERENDANFAIAASPGRGKAAQPDPIPRRGSAAIPRESSAFRHPEIALRSDLCCGQKISV